MIELLQDYVTQAAQIGSESPAVILGPVQQTLRCDRSLQQ